MLHEGGQWREQMGLGCESVSYGYQPTNEILTNHEEVRVYQGNGETYTTSGEISIR